MCLLLVDDKLVARYAHSLIHSWASQVFRNLKIFLEDNKRQNDQKLTNRIVENQNYIDIMR